MCVSRVSTTTTPQAGKARTRVGEGEWQEGEIDARGQDVPGHMWLGDYALFAAREHAEVGSRASA